MSKALGLIEVNGYLAAVEAADSALKAADVTLIGLEVVKAAITVVKLTGDVAAVNAAVDAGRASAEALGRLRTSHVIPRLDEQLNNFLIPKKEVATAEVEVDKDIEVGSVSENKENLPIKDTVLISSQEINLEKVTKIPNKESVDGFIDELIDAKNRENGKDTVKVLDPLPIVQKDNKILESKAIPLDRKSTVDYASMKVDELRRLARNLKLPMTNKQIKFAKKDELIKAIEENKEAGDK